MYNIFPIRWGTSGIRMKILVVDDDRTHLKLASLVLLAAGHNVTGAEAAAEAFSAIKRERPDVILLDLSLPGINGLALVQKLKADPETSAISVVGVTAYPERYTKKEALAAGFNSYLIKPIDTRTLPGLMNDAAEATESKPTE
jgi:two-component system cell cycle response regulator DivK